MMLAFILSGLQLFYFSNFPMQTLIRTTTSYYISGMDKSIVKNYYLQSNTLASPSRKKMNHSHTHLNLDNILQLNHILSAIQFLTISTYFPISWDLWNLAMSPNDCLDRKFISNTCICVELY